MLDLQSLGISNEAITTYEKFYNFALLVASKLNDVSDFTGYIDNFGYTTGLDNHNTYPVYNYENVKAAPFFIDGTDDSIDLDLKDVDASLRIAKWEPTPKDNTCMIFFSAAPESTFGGTTIKTTYDSFTTVVGVIVRDGLTSIPGLPDPVVAVTMTDEDAQAVVQKLLTSLNSY